MRIFDFINDIDWSKNIIFFILYMTIISLSVIFYLAPIIQNHKLQTQDYKKSQNLQSSINKNMALLQDNLEKITRENNVIYKSMRHQINLKDIEKYLADFMTHITITDNGVESKDNDTQIQHITISGNIKGTRNLISLFENIDKLGNSIRIAFPLKIEKQNNASHTLKATFGFDVYYSNYPIQNLYNIANDTNTRKNDTPR